MAFQAYQEHTAGECSDFDDALNIEQALQGADAPLHTFGALITTKKHTEKKRTYYETDDTDQPEKVDFDLSVHDGILSDALLCFFQEPRRDDPVLLPQCERNSGCNRKGEHVTTTFKIRNGIITRHEKCTKHPGMFGFDDDEEGRKARQAKQRRIYDQLHIKQCEKNATCERPNRHPGLCRLAPTSTSKPTESKESCNQ